VSVWVHVDDLPTPAHVEVEIIRAQRFTSVVPAGAHPAPPQREGATEGQIVYHRARLAGAWGDVTAYQVTGSASLATMVARLTMHSVWLAQLEVDGRRYDLPRDTAARWARLVELQALALGVTQ
jgi:hypothetical protein